MKTVLKRLENKTATELLIKIFREEDKLRNKKLSRATRIKIWDKLERLYAAYEKACGE